MAVERISDVSVDVTHANNKSDRLRLRQDKESGIMGDRKDFGTMPGMGDLPRKMGQDRHMATEHRCSTT